MQLPNRFINWRTHDGRKVPCRPDGTTCDPHDPAVWLSEAEARAAPYNVGWVLNGDGWFFLDLDKCRDGDAWAAEADMLFRSFAGAWGEVSQSGTGLHILGRCDPSQLADRRNKWGGDKEFYVDKRFIAFGPHGWAPIGGAATDTDWTAQLLKLVPQREHLGDLPDGRDPTYTGPEDDETLIGMARRSRSKAGAFGEGVSFDDLWTANVEALAVKFLAYDANGDFDHSSADASLMSHLAFWTGKDMPRMDRLFRQSALMRDKYEKRADYRRYTIQNAARLCKQVYNAPHPQKDHESGVPDQDSWEPLPPHFLEPQLRPAPELDPHAFLTKGMADWIAEAAEAKCAPVDYVFWAMLSVSASLIGNARRVCPNPSWSEPVKLWTVCIGNPSAGKSPAMDAILDPLRAIERPLRKKAQRDLADWKSKKQLADLVEQGWKKQVREAANNQKPLPPQPPAMQIDAEPFIPRLMITDSTIEKLAMICQAQPKGVLQVRDELAGWLGGMTRYQNSSDRPFWIEAAGGRPYAMERVGRETVTIPHLLITVLGGIQPDRLKTLMLEGDDDGLFARFTPIWPDRLPDLQDVQSYDDYLPKQIFDRLDKIMMPCDQAGDPMPSSVFFSEDAQKPFRDFRLRLRELESGESGMFLSYLGKLAGVTAVLALLLTYLRWAEVGQGSEPHKINVDDVNAAVQLSESYLIPMARRTYGAFDGAKDTIAAKKLLEVIKRKAWSEFSKRDLLRALGSNKFTVKDLQPPLSELAGIGIIREQLPSSNLRSGRPSSVRFDVNPRVFA